MREFFGILQKEIRHLLNRPGAYFVVAGFLLLSAFFFFEYLGRFNRVLNEHLSIPYSDLSQLNLNQWVIEYYFHTIILLFLVIVPLLSMNLIAGERGQRTLEMLLTSPVKCWTIVSAKFTAIGVLVVLLSLAAGVFPLLLWILGNPEGLPIVSGLVSTILAGLTFVAVSIACSAACQSTASAGGLSLLILFAAFLVYSPAGDDATWWASLLRGVSPIFEAQPLIKGVLNLSSLVYFLSITCGSLIIAESLLKSRR